MQYDNVVAVVASPASTGTFEFVSSEVDWKKVVIDVNESIW